MKTATLNGFEVCFPEIPEGATDVVFIGDNEKYPTVFFRHKDGFKYDMPAPTYPAEFVEWVLQNYTPVKSLTAYAWWDKVIGSDNYFTTAQLYKHWKENIQSQSK